MLGVINRCIDLLSILKTIIIVTNLILTEIWQGEKIYTSFYLFQLNINITIHGAFIYSYVAFKRSTKQNKKMKFNLHKFVKMIHRLCLHDEQMLQYKTDTLIMTSKDKMIKFEIGAIAWWVHRLVSCSSYWNITWVLIVRLMIRIRLVILTSFLFFGWKIVPTFTGWIVGCAGQIFPSFVPTVCSTLSILFICLRRHDYRFEYPIY